MSLESARHNDTVASPEAAGILDTIGAAVARRVVACISIGKLTIVTPTGTVIEHGGAQPGPEGVWTLHNWRGLRRLFLQGDLGFALSYLDGDWSSPDLAALIGVADRNSEAMTRFIEGYAPLRLANRLRHRLRANTKRGSRKNIEAHYDLGNEFYKLWLDPTMTYSSALFRSPEDTLESAQAHKISRIVDLLQIPAGGRLLEIGCGWGALLKAAAAAAPQAHLVGLTLSPSQRAHALETLRAAGLGERAEVLLQDYRDVDGGFDRIVSIEMIEAVGEEYWPAYFKTIADRLNPGGHAVIQAITIREDRFEAYRSSVDFIQRYIFPGGMLPTPTIIHQQAGAAGLTAETVELFGQSYAKTLKIWRQRFNAVWPAIATQGFDERFRRMWEYYLAYCEAGFRNGTIDVGFYKLEKPARA